MNALDYFKQLQEADRVLEMAYGFPAGLLDDIKVYKPDHPASLATTEYVERVLTRLFTAQGKTYTPGDFRVVLTDNPDYDFGITPPEGPATKPTIKLGKGLFLKGVTEDQLAGLIMHELSHKKFRETVKIGEVGKLEELAADVRAAIVLEDAGYQRDALLELSRRLQKESKTSTGNAYVDSAIKYLDIMTDEHPSWDHRVRALENTKVALDRLRGNQKPTPATPLDAAVVDLAGTAKWSSIADQWYQKFKPTWLTAADEFKAMGEVIEYSRDAALPHSMRALFESIVAHIALDTQDAGEMKAMNDFANILVRCSSREASMNESVQLPNNYGETYGQLEQNYTNQLERQNRKEAQQRTHPLLGDGAVLHLAMETFINPESSLIDRIDAAETIVRIGRENMTEKGNHAFLDLGYY